MNRPEQHITLRWVWVVPLFMSWCLAAVPNVHGQTDYTSSVSGGDNPLSGIPDPAVGVIQGDFDSDGDVDVLAFDDENYDSFTFYANDGTGSFSAATGPDNPFSSLSASDLFFSSTNTYVADFDNDGDVDIWDYEGSSSGDGTTIYLENDGGSYTSSVSGGSNPLSAVPDPGEGVIVGDFDSDDDIDVLAFDDETYSTFSFFANNGSGSFSEVTGSGNPFSSLDATDLFFNAIRTYVADFDNDGDVDVWDYRGSNSSGDDVYLENDNGSYTSSLNSGANPLSAVPDVAEAVIQGDFDADDDVDVLAFDDGNFDSFSFYANDGSGSFSVVTGSDNPFSSLSDSDLFWSADKTYVADFDVDEDVDIWDYEGQNSNDGTNRYLKKQGAPNTAPTVATNTGSTTDEGTNDTITQSELETTDSEQSASNLTYTIDSDVSEGDLFVSGSQIDGGGTFTQKNINDGNVEYRHDGSEPTSESFDFTVADGAGGSASGTFNFTINDATDVVVNDGTLESTAPCNATPDENTVSAGLTTAAAGEDIYVCEATYSETDLTVDADLTLDANASVNMSGTLTLTSNTVTTNGSLTLTSTGESSSARIDGSGSGTISGDVTVERFIDYAPTDASHWRMMASPFGGALDEVSGGGGGEHATYGGSPLLSNTWTQGDGMTGANYQSSGADPSVFYYDESASVADPQAGWAAVNDLTNPTGQTGIGAQEGFAVFLFQDRDFDGSDEGFPITLAATGAVSGAENDGSDVTLPVTCTDNDGTGSDGCTDSNDGWNLVANPFFSHFDWTSGSVSATALKTNAYVYDADNSRYQQTDGTNGGDAFIAPFQAFFVKSNATDGNEGTVDLKVNSGAKADPGASGDREFKSVEDEPLISLQLTGNDRAEETRLTFREGSAPGPDRYDGYQLTPLGGDYHLLATEMTGHSGTFDSQYHPLPSDSLTVGLTVTTTSGGTYTIETDTLRALPADLHVNVVDTETGESANLRAGESLAFAVEGSSTAPSKQKSPRDLLAEGPVQKTTQQGVIEGRFELHVVPGSAIPVELTNFDATTEGTAVQLLWQTASETNNAGFAVERRVGARERGGVSAFTQVGFVVGAGTTDEPQIYRFTDEDIPFEAETLRYRLRQKDLDGTTTLSKTMNVTLGAPAQTELRTPFPNPTRQQVTLRYETSAVMDVQVALYDVLGRRLRTVANGTVEAGRHERAIQVGTLPAGTYFLRMRAGETTQTRQFTIVR